MNGLALELERLMKIVDEVNDRINNLAASTEEIAVSAALIGKVSDKLKNKFETFRKL